jgi:diguanylate cyclase (GGDEF)-like protein/PAS domain S-box-containing protein
MEIAERLRIEGDLRASEKQFRMLFESSVVPILLLRGDKYELVNSAYLRLVGARDASEILGRPFLEFTAPEESENAQKVFRSFLAGESLPEIYESVGLRLDGSTFPCEVSAAQLQLPGEPATLVYLMDITDRKISAERLQFLSTHDSLTGLYNRAYFDQILDQEANQPTQPLSMLVLDVNELKRVNDTWGHAVGDVLLKNIANVLQRAMRGEDIVARIGGDEFVVVMPSTDREAAGKVVARIQAAILSHNESHTDHPPISIAIGCATVNTNEALVDAMKRADEAMYVHKREKVS